MSSCRTCRAPLVWAYTETGKRMPFDAHPAEDGSWVIRNGTAAYDPFARGPRYRPHFATCPDADQHRRR